MFKNKFKLKYEHKKYYFLNFFIIKFRKIKQKLLLKMV